MAARLSLFLQEFSTRMGCSYDSAKVETMHYCLLVLLLEGLTTKMHYGNLAWFFPAFEPWYGLSMPVVSYYRIVTTQESRAAPRSLQNKL